MAASFHDRSGSRGSGNVALGACGVTRRLWPFRLPLTSLHGRYLAQRWTTVDAKASELRDLWNHQLQEHVKTHEEQAESARMLRFLESFDGKKQ
jgi:hypothetical protein